jgi:hypothetical protein
MVDAAIESVRGREPCPREKISTLSGTVAAGWDTLLDDPQHARYVAALRSLPVPEATHA